MLAPPCLPPYNLQDYTRTGMYYTAIMENRADFEGKVVLDVGAGSGILSLFAAMVRWPCHTLWGSQACCMLHTA